VRTARTEEIAVGDDGVMATKENAGSHRRRRRTCETDGHRPIGSSTEWYVPSIRLTRARLCQACRTRDQGAAGRRGGGGTGCREVRRRQREGGGSDPRVPEAEGWSGGAGCVCRAAPSLRVLEATGRAAALTGADGYFAGWRLPRRMHTHGAVHVRWPHSRP